MLITPNFDDVQDAVVPGTYKVTVKKAVTENSDKGTRIAWHLETWGESESKNNGRMIFHRTPTSGPAVFLLQRLYQAATGQALTGAFDTDQLLGKQIEVEVGEREYNGKIYTDVKAVRAVASN